MSDGNLLEDLLESWTRAGGGIHLYPSIHDRPGRVELWMPGKTARVYRQALREGMAELLYRGLRMAKVQE
jgi:hypothetical protein